MKRLFLSLILLICLSMGSLMAYIWYDTEINDDWWNAQQNIESGSVNEAYWVGNLWEAGDIDWFRFPLNNGNRCQIEFVTYDSQDLSVQFYSDIPPTIPELPAATPASSFTSAAVTAGTDYYYARVTGTATVYPCNYTLKITNLDDPTFLPVTLSLFTAIYSNNGVGITWTTQSESRLNGYNLIRNENSSLEGGININGALILANNTSTTKTYTFRDEELDDVGEYYYWLEVVGIEGSIEYHGPVQVEVTEDNPQGETPDVNLATRIVSSYPNPFSSCTDVSIEMSKALSVEMSVYNIRGEKVNVIHNGQLDAGTHVFNWNGKDIHGRSVSNGIYFFRLNTYEGTYTHKLTFIK